MLNLIKLLTILFLISGFSYSQTVDEILEQYFETVGQEKILEETTLKAVGKILQGGMEIPFTAYQKRPMKMRTEGTFQGMQFLQGYDGEKGWSLNPFMGQTEAVVLTEEQNDQMTMQADFDGPYYNYKEKGYKMELTGTETMDDIEVYVIKLTRPNGDVITTYFDAENYVPLKTKSKTKVQGVETEAESFFSNYKETSNGVIAAHSLETKVGGQTVMQMVFDEIYYGVELDDSIFEMPKAEKKGTAPEAETDTTKSGK
jgi:hypothetical protein